MIRFPSAGHGSALSHLSALIALGVKGDCRQDGCQGLGTQPLATERCFFFAPGLTVLEQANWTLKEVIFIINKNFSNSS